MFGLSSVQFGMKATPKPDNGMIQKFNGPSTDPGIAKKFNGPSRDPGMTKIPTIPGSGAGKMQSAPFKIGSSMGKMTNL